jgi:hypothetical protein
MPQIRLFGFATILLKKSAAGSAGKATSLTVEDHASVELRNAVTREIRA